MTGIFDGLAGALADTFGAPVTHQSSMGPVRTIVSVFREMPVEVFEEDGRATLVMQPVWRVPLNRAQGIERGDEIVPVPGRRFRVLNRQASGSPAADATVTFELEEIVP